MRRLFRLAVICALFSSAISCGRRQPPAPKQQAADSLAVQEHFDMLLMASNPDEQARLADELEALGVGAIPYLESRLRAGGISEQSSAMLILQRLNEQRLPAQFSEPEVRSYLSWLSDDHVMVRTYAMESLIKAGKAFAPVIRKFQEHADPAMKDKLDIVLREQR